MAYLTVLSVRWGAPHGDRCAARLVVAGAPNDEFPCIRRAGHDSGDHPTGHQILGDRRLTATAADLPFAAILNARTEEDLRVAFKAALPDRDDAFDDRYVAGIWLDQYMPALPLERRSRFRQLCRLFATAPPTGAVAECGCWFGLSSYLLCHAWRDMDPAFEGAGYHIYDSFEGLGAPTPEDDADDGIVGAFASTVDIVRHRLAEFPAVQYHPGWIPHSFDRDDVTTRYRFVHVDVDLYAPTLASFEYFSSRLLAGGLMVCDDFGAVVGARRAVLKFAKSRPDFSASITSEGQAVFTAPA